MSAARLRRRTVDVERIPVAEPKPRRLRSSRRSLAIALIGVAILGVAILGIVSSFFAADVLNSTIETQLRSVAAERATALEDGIHRIRADVSAAAVDRSVAAALDDIGSGFADLEAASVSLTPDEEAALESFYRDQAASAAYPAGTSPLDLLPNSEAGRYLQYHYIVDNPFPADRRFELSDTGDGTAYSNAHAAHHPGLVERARAMGVDDLLLISTDLDDVIVYSTDKKTDFATSLSGGPYAASALASAFMDRLAGVPAGETILVDFDLYPPSGEKATMFAVAAVRRDAQVIGAIAVTIPDGVLDDLMTFDERWPDVGLGKSGEIYLVGADQLMRSVSRLWVEDPDRYLSELDKQGYPPDVGETIVGRDSTVLAQPVDTAAVTAALEDRSFSGTTDNYLGTKTRTIAEPLRINDLSWVIVAGFSSSDAIRPIRDYLLSLALIMLILVPIVALIGFILAGRLTRPIQPLVETVGSIADGDLDARVPDLGRNEYGDLGNRINTITGMLRDRDTQREAAEKAIDEVLLAALPESVVASAKEAAKEGRIGTAIDLADLVDTATIVSVSVSGAFDDAETDAVVATSISLAADLDRIAHEFSIERVQSTPEEYLFAAGLRSPGFAADQALRFIDAVRDRLDRLDDETDEPTTYRAGVATGRVASGLQTGDQISYGVWGPPVRRALSLAGIARSNETLVDPTVAEALETPVGLTPITVTDLQGNPVEAFILPRTAGGAGGR